MPVTGNQLGEIVIGLVVVIFFVWVAFSLGLRLPENKSKKRYTIVTREQPPDQPVRQLIIKDRTYNYVRWDITLNNLEKGIKVGTLYYSVPGQNEPTAYSSEFDPKKHAHVDSSRLFDENREYVTIVEEGTQTPDQVALTLSRAENLVLKRNIKRINDQLGREGHSKEAKALHAEMVKGMRQTGASPTGMGQSPAPGKDAATAIAIPQNDGEGEDENDGED